MTGATLVPAHGPADPPSSRPRAGVLGGRVHAYAFDPRDGAQRVRLPVDGFPVTPHTVVHWAFYADDAAAVAAPWASLAVCLDVVFDDGSRLCDGVPAASGAAERLGVRSGAGTGGLPALDRYGFAVTPADQFAARWSIPEQWNANTVALDAWAGRRAVAVEVVLGNESLRTAKARRAAGFIEVRIAEDAATEASSPAERVDTRRGSHAGPRFSRGNTLPLVAMPHGFAFVTPATDAGDTSWPYRPFLHDDEAGRRLEALQISHQPSPWIGDRTVLQFMPFAGGAAAARAERRLFIPRGHETAHPHRYAADLVDAAGAPRVAVAATATSRVAVLRVTGRGRVGLVVDQPTDTGRVHVESSADGRARVWGWVHEGDPQWGNPPRMYFAGRTQSGATGRVMTDAEHPHTTASVTADELLELRVATSFVSVDQAWRTLALEADEGDTFDVLEDRARSAWDAVCGAIDVPRSPDPRRRPADDELRATVAADLYRLHLYPNDASENAGTADAPEWVFADVFARASTHGDDRTGAPVASGRLVVNNGYWDTYRTVWPLLNLMDAPLSGALIDGQMQQARHGGWMARWSAPGYVDCMVGTSSDQIMADAHAWGVPGLDAVEAFATGWRNACEPAVDRRTGRAGVGVARFTGYTPRDVPEGFSWSIEAAIADAALGRMAGRLAQAPEAPAVDAARMRAFERYFANRARAYRRLFDADAGFFRGRERGGGFAAAAFDPRVWGGDYVETNGWGMSVSAVHDGAGLAALYGGPAALRRQLDRLFAEPETADPAFGGSYGGVIHEQREARAQRSGMCALSNQPAHHIPFMHVYGDRPWLAGVTANALARRLFAGSCIGQGYPGDEDNGEMSAWWLWALIGLYPLELASGELRVTDPLADDVTVRTAGGMLRVVSHRENADAHVLCGVRLNGVPQQRATVPVRALRGDVLLELEFAAAAEPGLPLWRGHVDALRRHPDLGMPARTIAAPGVSGGAVFDDWAGDRAAVPLAAGAWIGQDLGGATRVTDITLTVRDAAPAGCLVVEHSDDGASWTAVSTTHAEALPADPTTPFQVQRPPAARFWRLRATAPVVLRQWELFCLDEQAAAR